jgi:hypothetical protein
MQTAQQKDGANARQLNDGGHSLTAFFDRNRWLRAILLTAPMAFASFFTTGAGVVFAPTDALLEYFTPSSVILSG